MKTFLNTSVGKMKMINKTLKRLNRDSLPHFTRIALQQTKQYFDTKKAYMSAKWWNVELGKGCTFLGKIYFRRAPESNLQIGSHSRFLSSFSANLHGLNRNCMLTTLRYGAEIIIGKNVGMSGTIVAAASSIKIGNRVFCGANTTLTDTDSHSLDFRDRVPSAFPPKEKNWVEPVGVSPIVIEDDVFLGLNVLVLKGVRIGRGTVVAAGSIVTNDLPAYSIAAGQPAKVVALLKDRYPDIERVHANAK